MNQKAQNIKLGYLVRRIKPGTRHGSMYQSYRFSKSSNFMSFDEWKKDRGIKSLGYMAEYRAAALGFINKQLALLDLFISEFGLTDSAADSIKYYKNKKSKIEKHCEQKRKA